MRRFLLICALALLMTAVACGSDSGSADTTGGSGTSARWISPRTTPAPRSRASRRSTLPRRHPQGRLHLRGVPAVDRRPVLGRRGLRHRAAGQGTGIKINFNAANGDGDTANQLRHFDTFATQGVDGIIVGAVDNEAIVPAIDASWKSGVPVEFVAVSAAGKRSMGVTLTDDALAGQAQADYIAKADPERQGGHVLRSSRAYLAELRRYAFKARLKEKAPNAKILAEKYNDYGPRGGGRSRGQHPAGLPGACRTTTPTSR